MSADPRTPVAKARDFFMESAQAQGLLFGSAEGQYLRNRLEWAFIAGWDAAVKEATRRVREHIAEGGRL